MFIQSSEDFERKENFEKFDFLIDLMRRRLRFSILISLPKSFSPITVIVRSKFWRLWKKRELSKVWFFDWSYETKTAILQFWYPCRKLSPSTVNVRSKFRRVWKKRQLSEVWFFYWSFETKTAIFIFGIPAENFLAKHSKGSFKVLKTLKKKTTFRSLIFWLIFWDEDCNFQFWYPCRKFFRQAWWMFVLKPEKFEKKSELPQKILLKVFLWTPRMQF